MAPKKRPAATASKKRPASAKPTVKRPAAALKRPAAALKRPAAAAAALKRPAAALKRPAAALKRPASKRQRKSKDVGKPPPPGPGLVVRSYGILGRSNKEQKVEPPNEDTILVDPAGLPFIRGDRGPCDARGAAQANYQWLEISEAESFPPEVKEAITEECQAKYYAYADGKKKCIHVVGPDFRQTDEPGLTLDEAVDKLAVAYRNVFEEFCTIGMQPGNSSLRTLRLLPISGGIFSGPFKEQLPEMTARAVQAAYDQLSEDQKHHIASSLIEMCIFMESEFDMFAFAFAPPPIPVEAPSETMKRPAAVLKHPVKIDKVLSCPHSVANFSEVVVERMDIQMKVHFDRQVLAGICQLSVRYIKKPSHLLLDVLALAIDSVWHEDGQLAVWEVQESPGAKSHFGQTLRIELPAGKKVTKISVKYETTEKSTALQWLTKEQTQGKEHPLCFTQSQAICGRSILPCQDTPSVKATFSLMITVPAELTAVASGEPICDPVVDGDWRTFYYEQKVPVMSYLIGIVVAHLECCDIGPRSKCYAEPGIIKAAQKEFQDIVEEFLVTAQEVVGGAEYEWGSYNVAVMPSSFAYGGMENPNCTFMSASLIPGDRSLTPTLAHEIVHSWIGNLVTNALWKDFWLNEGFTRYIERRILSKIYGPGFRGLLLLVGYNDLVKTVDMLTKQGTPGLTRLEPEINDIDPDDAFSRVPYEKGSLFLFYLEQIVGGEEAMTDWLRAYIHSFRERSIQTSDVKRHFLQFFKGVKRVKEIDWEHWLYGEGLPDFNLADYVDRSLVDESKSLADSWLSTSTSDAKTEHMKAQQWMLFLDHLINAVGTGTAISHSTLEAMDGKYKISSTSNVEVSFRWCLLGCKLCWPGCLALTEHFLANHGRGVYVKPLYLALKAFDLERAKAVFQQNRNFYMTVVTRQIAAFLD